MAQFLIVVQVPEVEPLVATLRARFDPSARRGLGAHITVLHSNMPSDHMDPTAVEQITAAVSGLVPFNYWITRVARFPGTLYLAAAPDAPFILLRDQLNAALLTGEREQRGREPLIPHVSVVRKSAIDDREVEAELTSLLERHAPISCVCKQIVLLENSSGGWRPVQEFVLSGDTGSLGQAPS
jgi:2'-5' RNA ligase superfamily